MTALLATSDPVLLDFAELVGTEGNVAVEGKRTRWEVGGMLDADARVISAPNGIVDYKPDEMTAVVRAGTTVAELHAALAEKGQRSALPERGGTVGGALAVGESDFRSLGRGLIRTCLLQIRYVSAEGRIISSGGPTVKNVSGFDLPRLMVGSLGTLGLLAEAIIRTNPIPPASQWLSAPGVPTRVVADALLSPSALYQHEGTTWVQIEGHATDVAAEIAILKNSGDFHEVDAPDETQRSAPAPKIAVDPVVAALNDQVKRNFDPDGRLNPGRDVLAA